MTRRGFIGAALAACAACRASARAGIDRPFVIVFGPHHAPRNAEALRSQWSTISKLELELRIARDAAEGIDAIQSRRADAALLSLFDYLYCADVFGVEPVAQVIRAGNRDTHAGELVVRADSGVTTIQELRDQRVGFVDRYSITGFLLPMALLRDAKIAVEPIWTGTHESVLAAVSQGTVAAGATYVGHAANAPGLRVLTATTEIANEPLFVQGDAPRETRDALLKALTSSAHPPDLLAGIADVVGFRAPEAQAYRLAMSTVKTANQRAEDLVPRGWSRANEHRRPVWASDPY